MLKIRHPFFLPLWRRIAVTVVLALWTAFELLNGHMTWGAVFGALTLFCVIEFFIVFDPKNYEDQDG